MAHFKPILHAFQALTFGGVFDVDRNRGQHESPSLSAVRESAVSHADAQMPRLSAVHRPFDGVTLLARTPSEDHRGVFDRLYCSEELSGFIGGRNIAQANRSVTRRKGVVRGMHFQAEPYAETKIIACLRGEVFDVAIDMRPSSPTYLRWYGAILSAQNARSMVISEGFAHGFQTLSEDCEMLYLHTAPFQAEAERGVRPTDPAVNIDWPLPITELSPRDAGHPLIIPRE
jgi:dTDP-4-dehydrorhamnose 3,5-epimerase